MYLMFGVNRFSETKECLQTLQGYENSILSLKIELTKNFFLTVGINVECRRH